MWIRYSLVSLPLSYDLPSVISKLDQPFPLLPYTWPYLYKLHPTPLCQTRAGIRGWCRCGTVTWTQCLCQHSGLSCGSTWPAEGSRGRGRGETDLSACGIMRALSSKFKALCSKMRDTYTFQMTDKLWYPVNEVTKPVPRPKCTLLG